jgi:hypothetical protein
MPFAGSFALIAIGAILRYAVTTSVKGFSVGTVGLILMIVGVVGLVLSVVLMMSRRRTDVRYDRNGVTYVEPVDAPVRRF